MKVLLDTHALIWGLEGSRRLSKVARSTIEDGSNEILVSAVSAWEIAIKKARGLLVAPDNLAEVVLAAGFTPLFIGFEEARVLEALPAHHRDPFDRMLIAQAIHAGAPLVTADRQFAPYQVQLIW